MHRAASLALLICLSAAPALASEGDTPLARTPSEMTGAEIDLYNQGRASTDADYIRCRRLEQVGSLVKKLRVCNTNADWKRIADRGNQEARDSMEWIQRGFSSSQEPKDQIMPSTGRPQ